MSRITQRKRFLIAEAYNLIRRCYRGEELEGKLMDLIRISNPVLSSSPVEIPEVKWAIGAAYKRQKREALRNNSQKSITKYISELKDEAASGKQQLINEYQRKFPPKLAHPTTSPFALMGKKDLSLLVKDVEQNGLLKKIVLLDDMIVDGRNRDIARQIALVEPEYEEYTGKADELLSYIISCNRHRLHVDSSSLAIAAAEIATMRRGDNQHSSNERTSLAEAVKLTGANLANAKRASVILKNGSKELIDSVKQGEIKLGHGEEIARSNHKEQHWAIMNKKLKKKTKGKDEPTSDIFFSQEKRPHKIKLCLTDRENKIILKAMGADNDMPEFIVQTLMRIIEGENVKSL